jgi:hypothetical protein
VEGSQVAGIQQKTLRGDQSLASTLEGAGLSGISRVCRTGVLAKGHEHFVLHNVAAVGSTNGLLSSTLTGFLAAGVTPEAITIKLDGLAGLFATCNALVSTERLFILT